MTDNNNQIKISVIIPVYNVQEYIGRCIESLKAQTVTDIELIFVDDCSTDDSLCIIEKFAREDNRVRILKNEVNVGAGPSRNRGIEAASGDYLSFVDPDDWLSKDYYEILCQKAKEKDYDIVKTVRKRISQDFIINESSDLNKRILKGMKKGVPLYYLFTYEHTTAIYKASLFQDSSTRYGKARASEDTVFLLRICSKTEFIALIEGGTYYYFKRQGSATGSYSVRRALEKTESLKERCAFFQGKTLSDYSLNYMKNWTTDCISDFYYALHDDAVSDDDRQNFINCIRDATALSDMLPYMMDALPELDVLLNEGYVIPTKRREGELVFREGLEQWTDFLQEHPEKRKQSYYSAYAISLLRYLASYFRSRRDAKEPERKAFVRQQIVRLPVRERFKILLSIPACVIVLLQQKWQRL